MDTNEIKKFVYDKIIEVNDECELTDISLLLDEEILDSVSILYLVTELENEYGIQIPLEDVVEENFKDIIHIADYIVSIASKKDV